MARSLLGIQPASALPTRTQTAPARQLAGAPLEARLRKKRSAAYIQAVTRLDAGGHVHSSASVQALIEAIRQELPDVQIDALPLGIALALLPGGALPGAYARLRGQHHPALQNL